MVLWGSTADGKLLCGAPQDALQRPLKEKEKEGHLHWAVGPGCGVGIEVRM